MDEAEIEAGRLKVTDFQRQQAAIPPALRAMRLSASVSARRWVSVRPVSTIAGTGQPELARGEHAAMPGDECAFFARKHQIDEAELTDGTGNLGDLALRMSPGIAGIGNELSIWRCSITSSRCSAPSGIIDPLFILATRRKPRTGRSIEARGRSTPRLPASWAALWQPKISADAVR
ncbi:MAG: hypothetical protein M3Z96_02930 [Pseudomonadota bacterium]|nr:hypothetical protein [Pseudomonadota bacterium]